MLNKLLFLMIAASLILAACQSAPVSAPTPAVLSRQEKVTDTPSIPTAEFSETAAATASKPGCTVVADQLSASDEGSLVPLPTDRDWITGPDDAYVTLIEYGDFQ